MRCNYYVYAACTWSENGKSRLKKFSYNKYGKDNAWVLAREYRAKMIAIFYKDF